MSYRSSDSEPPRKLQTLCRIEIHKLDIAKGHDGFLRGRPEPVVVFGVFLHAPSSLRLLDRKTCRFHRPHRFPGVASPQGALRFDLLLDYETPAVIVCAGFAIEEDSGLDVAEMAAALDRWQRLRFEPVGDAPLPSGSLIEWADALLEHDAPRPFDVLIDNTPALERFRHDDWIACSLYAFSGQERRQSNRRMHFTSHDGRNDWSLTLGVRLGSPRVWPDD